MNSIKIIFIAFLLITFSNRLLAQSGYSKKITDKWPYLFEEFHEGLLYFDSGKISKGSFNIDIANQMLVFFETDNVIKSVSKTITIDSLVLSNSKFYKSDSFYEVIAQSGSKLLLKKDRIDLNAAGDTGGGYGTGSATDASTKLTSIDVANYTGVPYEVMKLEKGKGKVFETISGYYISTGKDEPYQRATKNAFSEVFPNSDVKEIIKANGLKLNQEDDLILLFKKCQ